MLFRSDCDAAPMKELGALSGKEALSMAYTINTASPILEEEEERQARILGADYSPADIDAMANELDAASSTKAKLKQALKKLSSALLSGGLGALKCSPAGIEVGKDAKPYCSRCYAVPKAYEAALGCCIAGLHWRCSSLLIFFTDAA